MGRTVTAGVDLAAQPRNTGACLIDWDSGAVEIIRGPVNDVRIVALVDGAVRTGIDCPLGWPQPFIEAITAHARFGEWPVANLDPPEDRAPLRLRLTDQVTKTHCGLNPLSVSSDRIGVAAMRWARIEHEMRSGGVAIDRSGCTGKVAEVYPAGALRQWGISSRQPLHHLQEALLCRIAETNACIADSARDALEGCNRHQFDAFVCALVARDVLRNLTIRPPRGDQVLARSEGWIHLPSETSLDALVWG